MDSPFDDGQFYADSFSGTPPNRRGDWSSSGANNLDAEKRILHGGWKMEDGKTPMFGGSFPFTIRTSLPGR
jgi:hypothetical protein